MLILTNHIKEHVQGPRSTHLGTRDKDFTTDLVRVLGVMSTGHDTLKFFIDEKTSGKSLENLHANKIVSLSSTNMFTHESYQLKGRFLHMEPASQEDIAFIEEFTLIFNGLLSEWGYTANMITNFSFYHTPLAIEFVVDQVFDQTPKIGTGKLISTP